MSRRRRVCLGEPLGGAPEHSREWEAAMRPLDVRQVLRDLQLFGQLGAALQRRSAPAAEDSSVIEMREVAPGVFARAPNPPRRPRPVGILGRVQEFQRTVAEVHDELGGRSRRRAR